MDERFRRGTEGPEAGARSSTATTHTDDTHVADHDTTETTERRFTRDEHAPRQVHDHVEAERVEHVDHDRGIAAGTMRDVRARQREEFGGINWGSSFFGWLSAMGLAAILAGLVSAAGATLSLTTGAENDAEGAAETIGIAGGILLLILLGVAYFAGGYVAGRMSRFDGGRQGMATWAIGLIVTVGLALAAVLLGDEYNVLEQLNLPALPVGDETLATGALIALAAIAVGSLLAAMAGGKLGERYHKKVDRFGFVDDERFTSRHDGYADDKAASNRPV